MIVVEVDKRKEMIIEPFDLYKQVEKEYKILVVVEMHLLYWLLLLLFHYIHHLMFVVVIEKEILIEIEGMNIDQELMNEDHQLEIFLRFHNYNHNHEECKDYLME